MKIYVITYGYYSDYSIYGVTTNYERAVDMRDKVNAWNHTNNAEIEEYEDGVFSNDNLDHLVPCTYWRVTLVPGEVPRTMHYTDNQNLGMHIGDHVCNSGWKGNWEKGYKRKCWKEYTVENIRAETEEQAIKIAIDNVTQYRAKRENV